MDSPNETIPPITQDELIDALLNTEITHANPHGARTIQQLAELANRPESHIRKRLKQLAQQGILGVTRIQIKNLAGYFSSTPAYYIIRNHQE